MNPIKRILESMAPAYRAATASDGPLATPPAREPADRDVMHFSTVFRAVQVLETSIAGLPIRELKDGVEVTPSVVIDRPDPNRYRSEFVKLTVGDMIVRGEAFWLKLRGLDGTVKGLRVLPASLVSITDAANDLANPLKRYGYLGREYQDADILHLPFVSMPGRLHGIGPVEAGRAEINGAMDARDAKAMWFDEPAQPSGILSTDKMINDEIATNTKQRFEKNMKGVKVIGGGMTYTPLLLSPADMQYLETQKFDTTLLSRLFGIPPEAHARRIRQQHDLQQRGTGMEPVRRLHPGRLRAAHEGGAVNRDTARPRGRVRLGLVPPLRHQDTHGNIQDRHRGGNHDPRRGPRPRGPAAARGNPTGRSNGQ